MTGITGIAAGKGDIAEDRMEVRAMTELDRGPHKGQMKVDGKGQGMAEVRSEWCMTAESRAQHGMAKRWKCSGRAARAV